MDSNIILKNRKNLSVSGIEKVVSVSQKQLSMEMEDCSLFVLGENMEVKKLDVDCGNLEVEGLISEIKYAGKKEKTNLIKRIFK